MSNKIYSRYECQQALVLDGCEFWEIKQMFFDNVDENDAFTMLSSDGLEDDLTDYYYKHLFNFGEGLFQDDTEDLFDNLPQYIDCSVVIIPTGKYVQSIIAKYIDGKTKESNFASGMFTDNELINLMELLQFDHNVIEYNVVYW